MKKYNKKYIVICVAVILIIAIMVIYEITGNKNNSSQTDKSEYSVSTTDNEKNNADNFISDNKETQIRMIMQRFMIMNIRVIMLE